MGNRYGEGRDSRPLHQTDKFLYDIRYVGHISPLVVRLQRAEYVHDLCSHDLQVEVGDGCFAEVGIEVMRCDEGRKAEGGFALRRATP